MTIEAFVINEAPDGQGNKTLTLLMRKDNEIKQANVVVLVGEDVSSVNLQTAWLTAPPMWPGPISETARYPHSGAYTTYKSGC